MNEMHVLAFVLVAAAPCLLALTAHAEEGPDAPLRRSLASPPATGLLVVEVMPAGQAAAKGIRPGDVIVAYAGTPTPDLPALQAASGSEAAGRERVLEVVRADGATKEIRLQKGSIGVALAAVEMGEAVPPFPEATDVRFDFSALSEAPHDDWYAFTIPGQEGKRGFEHVQVKLEHGNVVVRREVAFDGGERWGVNHFDVSVVLTAEAEPKLVAWRFESPPAHYVAEGRVERGETPVLRFTATSPAGESDTTRATELPVDLPVFCSYIVETLASFMPRTPGACLHYRAVTDGSGAVSPRPSALVAVGMEEVQIGAERVPALKYEVVERYRGPTSTFWVGEDGHVVRADHDGPVGTRSTRDRALKDLHAGIRPRTAD